MMRSLSLILVLFISFSLCQEDDYVPEIRSVDSWRADDKGLSFASFAKFEDDDENKIKDRYAYSLTLNQGNSWFLVNWVYDRQQSGDGAYKNRYEVKYTMDYLVEFDSALYENGIFPGFPSKSDCGCFGEAPRPKSWKLVDNTMNEGEDGIYSATWEGAISDTQKLRVLVTASEKEVTPFPEHENFTVSPNMVKMDIGLENYEWIETEADSELAVGLSVQSKAKVRNEKESFVSRLELTNGESEGASFGWADLFMLGRNESGDVFVSALPSDGKQSIGQWYPLAFTFPVPLQGRSATVDFLWDPYIAVNYGLEPESSSAPVGLIVGLTVGGVVVIVLVGLALMYSMKKKSEPYETVA